MRVRSLAMLLALSVVPGCREKPKGTGQASSSPAAKPVATTASRGAKRERAQTAERAYLAWCAGCHGTHGKGDGPAAAVIDPKPRDFTRDRFKIRSTMSSLPPTAQDLFDTVTRGMPGSAMPSFAFLPEEERWLVVEHVRALAQLDEKAEPKTVSLGAAPAATPELIARGKQLYAEKSCDKCHGETGRGDGPSSADLKDSRGRLTPARDYSTGLYLGGDSAEAIHTRFVTGMDGTAMPSFGENFPRADGWALSYYILSLRVAKPPMPDDLVERGKRVVQERWCFACHVVDGKGGDVGPSLDVAAAKLRFDWAKAFLTAPLPYGKIYPYTTYRMPDFKLSPEEIDGVLAYLAKIAGRPYPEPEAAAVAVDEAKAKEGLLLYFLKCTECHNMEGVIGTPEAKRQGPDLINVSKRIHYEWMPTWVNNPKQAYPGARMVDTNLTPDQIAAVTAFVWKTSVEQAAKAKP